MDLSNLKEHMDPPNEKWFYKDGVWQMPATIPVPLEARIIAEVLKAGDPTVEVYVVGGAVRDFLYHKFHRGHSSKPYVPKDIDLATNLSEEDILYRLSGEEANRFLIRVKEKESVDTFGVVFVSVGGRGPYEVAPFRKDVGSSDGRRPEKVERATIREDAMRRDFTINNLYYDFSRNIVLDFNQAAIGIADIQNRRVRCVGDPFDRFDEDKLRILRMVRFFSRYNEGLMIENLDQRTLDAIDHYKNLMIYKGMSRERIMTEFLLGLTQSLDTATYLKNYVDLKLMDAVFDFKQVDLSALDKVGDQKSPKIVLALLLRQHGSNVANLLNSLKYPNDISDPVQFLVNAMSFDPKDAVPVLKERDKRLVKAKNRELTDEERDANDYERAVLAGDLTLLARLTDNPVRKAIIEHLIEFEHTPKSGEELMARGYEGRAIGEQQRFELQSAYVSSLRWYLKGRNLPTDSVE